MVDSQGEVFPIPHNGAEHKSADVMAPPVERPAFRPPDREELSPDDVAARAQAMEIIRQAQEAQSGKSVGEVPVELPPDHRQAISAGERTGGMALQKLASFIKSPFSGIMNLLKSIGRWIVK